MLISVVNRSLHLSDGELQNAVRAINRQLEEDFFPHWQFGARLRVDSAGRVPSQRERKVDLPVLPGRRGDAVIYVQDKPTMSATEGYHDGNNDDVPFGFVFLDVCTTGADSWTVALSHEAIELVGDPLNNLLVQGPDPTDHRRLVFHQFELCDAVSGECYEIEGVNVQNFLLPGWFARKVVEGGRNDFLGRVQPGASLAPFSIAAGGYLMYWDDAKPEGRKWTPHYDTGDGMAGRKVEAKMAAKGSRLGRRCHHG
ncbi:hypothetical protein [Scleromatobacter humisilvae]|uniref:Uncharacterized protein n=1 Tax=Scleromatobacter humisilvae TaxID=2897159 RepID=A0A9X1YDX2_9BURK|nr:hypothetical protein [Scleromatobacter humisilvae]MCK9684744.1 hypothetical protein [Scleromatobacter humisilvae]